MCCDPRRNVRHMAISYLQRALLAHDLQRLSPNEWEACFLEVRGPTGEGGRYGGGVCGRVVGCVGGWYRPMAKDCVGTLRNTAAVTVSSSLHPPSPSSHSLQVFFPMLSRLLEGVELMDAPSLEETRMRASQLLSKVHTCTAHTHLMSIYVHMLIKWAHSVVVGHAA